MKGLGKVAVAGKVAAWIAVAAKADIAVDVAIV